MSVNPYQALYSDYVCRVRIQVRLDEGALIC